MNIKHMLLVCSLIIVSFVANAQIGKGKLIEHTVKKSETVYSIAQRYDTTVEHIYQINSWAKDKIKEGDKLLLYTNVQEAQQRSKAKHKIQAGETVYRITKMYGITEEELIRANPGISVQNFPVGYDLNIPSFDSISYPNIAQVDTYERVKAPVSILIMLPFQKTPRYIEFYEGFLMGMNDLKKDGISMNLTTIDVANQDELERQVSTGALYGKDLVIGGVTEEQVELIARNAKSGLFIVPFSSQVHANIESDHLVRLNQPSVSVIERVLPRFMERYKDKTIVFVGRTQDQDELLARNLKAMLTEANHSFKYINLDNQTLDQVSATSVIVPVSSNRSLADRLLLDLKGSGVFPTIFAYPQWQSFGAQFLKSIAVYNTTIYSTFFFDPDSSEGKQFLTKYRAWFSKKTGNNFPKFSVLGYDVARYFVRGYASSGSDFIRQSHLLPGDGLQIDIQLERQKDGFGLVNSKFYFVTFASDGSVSRISL